MIMKKTAIIGASTNPARYSFKAANMLSSKGHEIIPLGLKKGNVANTEIITERPTLENVDTVTLYVNPEIQKQWYDYVLNMKPKRIIFNPGTENPEFEDLAEKNGIETIEACTLVLLASNQY